MNNCIPPRWYALLLLNMVSSPGFSAELFADQSLRFGIDTVNFHYKEPGLMQEQGWLPGLSVTATHYTRARLMSEFSATLYYGSTDYDGRYENGDPATTTTDNLYINGKLTIGQGMEVHAISYTPYIGLGIRYWHNDIKGAGGYNRYITQYYLPAGLHIQSSHGMWTIGGTLEGNLLLYGHVSSTISEADSAYDDDVHNHQRFAKGGGVHVAAFIEHTTQHHVTAGVEPYFEYWHFTNSDWDSVNYNNVITRTFVEPANDFYLTGIRLYLKF